MKANELRIGNWYKDLVDGNEKQWGVACYRIPDIEDVCAPIELTEDWLMRFGFIKQKHIDRNTGNEQLAYHKSGDYMVCKEKSNTYSIGIIHNNKITMFCWNIWEVHHLQNIWSDIKTELTIKETA